jgi:excisionase family DNA binding protein
LTELDNEVSTQEAASILNVSRPYVVKLFDNGEIKGRLVGNQRRMLRADVEAYHQKTKSARREGMVEMARLSQEIESIIEEKEKTGKA